VGRIAADLLDRAQGGEALPPYLSAPGVILTLLGPSVAALIAARLTSGSAGPRQLLRRLRIWRIGWGWYAFLFLYPPALHLVVVGIHGLWGGPAPRFFAASGVPEGSPLLVFLTLVLFNLVRGLGEETGWRGFALPRMQARWNSLRASLVLGLLWALWHFHAVNFSLLSRFAGWYILLVFPSAIIFTWVFNNTQGSLLAAILFHVSLDVAEWVVPLGLYEGNAARFAISAVVNWALACVLVIAFRAERLAKPRPEANT